MKKLLLFATLVTILFSCSKEQIAGEVLIRIQNQTSQTALNARIFSELPAGGNEVERVYGDINAGQSSDYRPHSVVYPTVFYSITLSDNSQLESRFIRCGNDIKRLPAGTYSLVIKSDGNNQSFVELIKD